MDVKKKKINIEYFTQLKKQNLYIEKLLEECINDKSNSDLREQKALTIATRLRVLLHDTKKQCSLLQKIDMKDKLLFNSLCSFSTDFSSNLLFCNNLTGIIEYQHKVYYEPEFYTPGIDDPTRIYFDTWWNEIIIDLKKENLDQVSRKDIVLTLSDKEGGAHFDSDYEHTYFETLYHEVKSCEVDTETNRYRKSENNLYIESLLVITKEYLNAFYEYISIKDLIKIPDKDSNIRVLKTTYNEHKNPKNRYLLFDEINRNLRWTAGLDFRFECSYSISLLKEIKFYCPNRKVFILRYVIKESTFNKAVYLKNNDYSVFALIYIINNKYILSRHSHIPFYDNADNFVVIDNYLFPKDNFSFDNYNALVKFLLFKTNIQFSEIYVSNL